MNKKPINVELTWSEAANLLAAAGAADTQGWTRAARGNLKSALRKITEQLPLDDPNAFFLIVRGQTVIKREGGK